LDIKPEINELKTQHQKGGKNIAIPIPKCELRPYPLKTNADIRPVEQT
jgi:hypothetical protein